MTAEPKVLVYSTTWCADCRRAKRLLDELHVPYREIDIEQNPEAAELVIRHNGGKRRVPTIAIRGGFYGNPSPAQLLALLSTNQQGESAMTTFSVHNQETAPEASRSSLAAAQGKFGFVPNLIGMLAESPAAAAGYLGIGEAFDTTSFSPAERQVVLLSVSYENQCDYCMAAHSVVAGMSRVPADVVEALRAGTTLPDARLDALSRFTRAVTSARGRLAEGQVEAFLSAGFTRAQVLEVVLGVAMKTLSNYANHMAQTPLDGAFASARWTPVALEPVA